jgi:hypothetical protein
MIRLIFKKDHQELLSFSLDSQGNYFNISGNDSWFNYDYQKNGLSRKEPRLWAEMLKSGYSQSGIDVEIILSEKKEKSFKKKLLLIPLIFLLAAGAIIFIPSFLSAKGPSNQDLIKETRNNLLKEIKTGSGRFDLTLADLEFSGSFNKNRIRLINRGPGLTRESIWANGFLYQRNQAGRWSKIKINPKNDFPLNIFIKAILNPNIKLKDTQSSAGVRFIDSFYKIDTKSTANSGIISQGSDYLLIVDQATNLPIEIAASKLYRPYLILGKKRNVSFKFFDFGSADIKIPTISQAFQSRG